MTSVNWSIINSHRQVYCESCIPSCVEMILKLDGRIKQDKFDEQSRWQNKSSSFAEYNGVTIEGLTFRHEFTHDRNTSFPMEDLFKRIADEIAAGRYVAISLESNNGWHMWVIYEDTGTEFLAFSKLCQQTIHNHTVRAIVKQMRGTDILTYTRGSGSSEIEDTYS